MRIGLISDIHRHLPQAATDALRGCDAIICAGDVEDIRIVWELQCMAPLSIVAGNCDHFTPSDHIPAIARPVFDGVRFLVVHRPCDIGHPASDIEVVVHGHTHIPRNEIVDGVRYLNPGSCSEPRGGSDASIAIVTLYDGRIQETEFVTLV